MRATKARNHGQSIGEYAILFAIVLGAVVAMQTYVRERLAGEIKAKADLYGTSQTIDDLNQTTHSVQTSTADMTIPGRGGITSDSQASQNTSNPRPN